MKHKRSDQRKPMRLLDYDYSQSGGYFLTICTYDNHQFLSRIVNDAVELTVFGKIVLAQWNGLPDHYTHVELDMFVVMPNHVHGIIFLVDDEQTSDKSETSVGESLQTLPYEQLRKSKRHGVPEIVRGSKPIHPVVSTNYAKPNAHPCGNVASMIILFVANPTSIVSVNIFCTIRHVGIMMNTMNKFNTPSSDLTG